MGHRYLTAGLALALVLLTSACGTSVFGHGTRGSFIESFSVVPMVLAPDGVAQLNVDAGEEWPDDIFRSQVYVPPTISATAGGLYLTRAEAEAGQRDYANQFYANGDLLHLSAVQAYFRAPATAQTVTLTASYGASRTVSVVVQ